MFLKCELNVDYKQLYLKLLLIDHTPLLLIIKRLFLVEHHSVVIEALDCFLDLQNLDITFTFKMTSLVELTIILECRYLRERKDVFKELKVLVEKGKVALHKLTKIYCKQYLQVQARLVALF